MGGGGGEEIDGDECVPKWNFLEVVELHEVKWALQVRRSGKYICFGGGVCVCIGGGEVKWSGGLERKDLCLNVIH